MYHRMFGMMQKATVAIFVWVLGVILTTLLALIISITMYVGIFALAFYIIREYTV